MNREEVSNISIKRVIVLGFLFFFIIMALIIKLFYIQVIKSEEYSKKAVQQRLMSISLGTERGNIYDRNLIPFTSRESKKYIIAHPAFIHDTEAAISIISKAACLPKDIVEEKLNSKAEVLEFLYNSEKEEYYNLIAEGRLKGVIAIKKKQRYSENSLCKHIIGYISKIDKKGEMGIEKSMDNYISNANNSGVIAVVDSSKNIIPGLGFRKVDIDKSQSNLNVKLTLDYHIQRITEEIMKKHNLNGSIVVMDITNGDVLASASYPDFDQNNIQNYINSSGEELINKSLWPYDLGSIFKTVVVAAALESNRIDLNREYLCEGSISVGNSVIQCSTHKTHENRLITLEEAFALSCNTTFVKIGLELGDEVILNMAKSLGFGEKQCYEILEEKPGYIPKHREEGIGNISIGQGKIQVTPLQVTTMMAAIANNGIKNNPILIDALVDNEGNTVKMAERSKPQIVMSPSTAYVLKEMLRKVTLYGTGKAANLDELGGSGGKTGTAETGMNYGKVTHGWFSGYVPAIEPQYAITVFINDGKSGSLSAAPIFREIAEEILIKIKR